MKSFVRYFRPSKKSVQNASNDLDFIRLDANEWELVEDISIDFAIMEKVKNLVAIPFGLGGQIWENGIQFGLNRKDQFGVALSNNATAIDCKDSLLRSENQKQHIVGLGLEKLLQS